MGELEHEATEVVAEKGSILEALRKQYQELAERTDVMLPVPGYNGILVAKYKLIDSREDLEKIGKRVSKAFPGNQRDQIYFGIVDMMIAANEGLYYAKDDESFMSIAEALGGGRRDDPITYSDDRLVEFFAWNGDVTGARQAVQRLFKNDSALMDHGRQLSEWMRDTSKDVNSDFLDSLR